MPPPTAIFPNLTTASFDLDFWRP